jgi:hypothetical protein
VLYLDRTLFGAGSDTASVGAVQIQRLEGTRLSGPLIYGCVFYVLELLLLGMGGLSAHVGRAAEPRVR